MRVYDGFLAYLTQCFSLEFCMMIWIFVLEVCELCRNFDYISLSFESRAALKAALVTIPGVFTRRSSHRATRKQDHQREVRRQRERQRRERKERRQAMKKAKKLRKERRKLKRNKGVECPVNDSFMNCFTHNNDHWKTKPLWRDGSFCACTNSNTNTYSCVRTINATHNYLYCEFVSGIITYYDLNVDPYQLRNIYQVKR